MESSLRICKSSSRVDLGIIGTSRLAVAPARVFSSWSLDPVKHDPIALTSLLARPPMALCTVVTALLGSDIFAPVPIPHDIQRLTSVQCNCLLPIPLTAREW